MLIKQFIWTTNPGLLLPFVSGGAYSYSWSTGDTTEDVTGLTSGAYCVTITDCNGCSVSVCDTVGIGAVSGYADSTAVIMANTLPLTMDHVFGIGYFCNFN